MQACCLKVHVFNLYALMFVVSLINMGGFHLQSLLWTGAEPLDIDCIDPWAQRALIACGKAWLRPHFPKHRRRSMPVRVESRNVARANAGGNARRAFPEAPSSGHSDFLSWCCAGAAGKSKSTPLSAPQKTYWPVLGAGQGTLQVEALGRIACSCTSHAFHRKLNVARGPTCKTEANTLPSAAPRVHAETQADQ